MIALLDRLAQAYFFWLIWNVFFCAFDVVAMLHFLIVAVTDGNLWNLAGALLMLGLVWFMGTAARRQWVLIKERRRQRREAEQRADVAHHAMGEWF